MRSTNREKDVERDRSSPSNRDHVVLQRLGLLVHTPKVLATFYRSAQQGAQALGSSHMHARLRARPDKPGARALGRATTRRRDSTHGQGAAQDPLRHRTYLIIYFTSWMRGRELLSSPSCDSARSSSPGVRSPSQHEGANAEIFSILSSVERWLEQRLASPPTPPPGVAAPRAELLEAEHDTGLHALETLLTDHMDRAMELFMAWAYRNVFTVGDAAAVVLVCPIATRRSSAREIADSLRPVSHLM